MTDLHTHILPGMDDGAENVEKSIEMLKAQRSQGVDTVVLTPHFYRYQENPKMFLERRLKSASELAKAMEKMGEERRELPTLVLGAEVAWRPDMAEWDELAQLCIGQTNNLLLELPFGPWSDKMLDHLYNFIGRSGVMPIIAHLDRYLKLQPKEYIEDVMSLGAYVQVGSDILCHPLHRSGAMKLLRDGKVHTIASDCHDMTHRPPNLAAAMQIIRRKLGENVVEDLVSFSDKLAGVS